VVLVTGTALPLLTIADNTEVSGFHNGITINDGTMVSQGAGVIIHDNRADGVDALGRAAGQMVGISDATIRNNGGKGLVVRSTIPVTAQSCKITANGDDGVDAQRTQANSLLAQPQFVLSGSTVSSNLGRGVALTGKGVGTGTLLLGGKVGAQLVGNTIASNAGVGVYVSEATDGADGDDVTEVWLEANDIGNNQTATVPATTLAGGVFFASADATTRIMLRQFLANKVHGNGAAEVGFNLSQNDTAAWNLSSNPVDPTTWCAPVEEPNAIYCYDRIPGDLAIAVSGTTIHVNVRGMHFQNVPVAAGRDYSTTIPGTEISSVCAPVACPP